jgi:hypothetical protein
MGIPAPSAAAIGSRSKKTSRAPASFAACSTARLSTRDARGNTNDHVGAHAEHAAAGFFDEVLEHPLGDAVVGDDAVLEGAVDFDRIRGAAQHVARGGTHGKDTPIALADRHDAGFF